MAWRMRLGLFLVGVLLAVAVAAGVLWVALGEAERGLVESLDGKAKAHARIVRGDVELALELRIPLELLPGAYDYLEGGAQADPDIRFVAITDRSLARLHYGGIGRQRLDPLLAAPALRASADAVARHPDQPLRSVTIDGFSLTPAPLFGPNGHAGFVVVAVQAKEIKDALMEEVAGLAPAVLAFLILAAELVAWTAASRLEEPWRYLRRMMRRLDSGRRLVWSRRHDRGELGTAMRFANGVFHRLRDRAERLALRTSEAERAVFDPAVARAIRGQLDELREPPLGALVRSPEQVADRRASDVQPVLVLLLVAAALGLAPLLWPAGFWTAQLAGNAASASLSGGSWLALDAVFSVWPVARVDLLAAGLGLLIGLIAAWIMRRPGWGFVAAGLVLLVAVLSGVKPPAPAAGLLAAGAGLALGAAFHHLRRAEAEAPWRWLALRLLAGLLGGTLLGLTLILEERLAVLPWLQLVALGLAVLAANRDPIVRRQLFARGRRVAVGRVA